jgi:hypothetical protein
LHQERCFEQSFFKNIPSRIVFFFFFVFPFVFIASVLLVSGNLVLSFLSGKHSSTVVHTNSLLSLDFSFIYHNTTWLDPGAGIWMHLQPGRDPIQAACFLLAFFPSVIFGSQEKDVHAAMRDARL